MEFGGGYGGLNMGYGQMGGMGYGQMGGGGEGGWNCVKLRGIPFDAHENDIGAFVACEVVDILMCRRHGRMTGEAFVVFPGKFQAQMALSKNGANMGRRYIEIFPANKFEYYNAVCLTMEKGGDLRGGTPAGESGEPAVIEHTGFLKMRGLPFEATVQEIVDWFGHDKVAPKVTVEVENVVLCTNFSGKPSGNAYVKFEDADAAKAAYAMHRENFGRRYVELFAATAEEFDKELERDRAGQAPPADAP